MGDHRGWCHNMRLWSLHPQYLDTKGLVAQWREALLAQHVLLGLTKGYLNHPQLNRFKAHPDPVAAIGYFLSGVESEAKHRNYNFNALKIQNPEPTTPLTVTQGQIDYEWAHLLKKLHTRDPRRHEELSHITSPKIHPLFTVIDGNIEAWEIL